MELVENREMYSDRSYDGLVSIGFRHERIELSKIVSDEKKVIQYLQQKAILKKFDSCPYTPYHHTPHNSPQAP